MAASLFGDHSRSSSNSRSRFSPRLIKPATASRLRPRCAPILGQRPALPVLQHERLALGLRQLFEGFGQSQSVFVLLRHWLGEDCSVASQASRRDEESASAFSNDCSRATSRLARAKSRTATARLRARIFPSQAASSSSLLPRNWSSLRYACNRLC